MPSPQYLMKAPVGVYVATGAAGKQFYVRNDGSGTAMVDADSCASLIAQGWQYADPVAKALQDMKSPYILAQSGTPTILLPAGVWNNTTGQMAVGTALPYLPTGVVLVYLFASGIAQAGLYQATFSGTPAAPVVQIVGNPATVAGAYTPSLGTPVVLFTVTLPGGAMGPNGTLRYDFLTEVSNSANTKTVDINFGAQAFGTVSATTIIAARANGYIRNRGAQNVQLFSGTTLQIGISNSGTAPSQRSVDTSSDKQFSFVGTINTSTAEFVIIDGFTIEVLPGA